MEEDNIKKTEILVSNHTKAIESVQNDVKEIKEEIKNIVRGNAKMQNLA